MQHDETNRAWWSGKWYGRGLGSSALLQPAREFIVKIVEMSLWSSDFITGHLLLFILTVPLLIPFFDRVHSTMLCEYYTWALPSVTDEGFSLASSVEANTSAPILDQTEETAPMDCCQVRHRVLALDSVLRCLGCLAYVFLCE